MQVSCLPVHLMPVFSMIPWTGVVSVKFIGPLFCMLQMELQLHSVEDSGLLIIAILVVVMLCMREHMHQVHEKCI